MTTIKLKKPAVPPAPGEKRAPLRAGGLKPPRPTLAQAQAERAAPRPAPAPAPASARAPAADRSERTAPSAPPRSRAPRAEGPRRDGPAAPTRGAPRGGPRSEPPRREPAARTRPVAPASRPVASQPELPRLSKRMSELGLASRREADEWIEQGFVRVDGQVVDQLGARVSPEQAITIDPAAKLQQAQRVTVLLHKPLGIVSGQAEDGHEPALTLVTAANRWKSDGSPQRFNTSQLKHLVPAGRLDLDSTGLLVLTQDGRIAKQLIGEDSKVEKEYIVRVAWVGHPEVTALHENFPPELVAKLRSGLAIDGEKLKPAKVSWQNEQSLRVVLREGKKRQIRRMCEMVGLQVLSLKRIRIGRIGLGELPAGQWRYLTAFESFL